MTGLDLLVEDGTLAEQMSNRQPETRVGLRVPVVRSRLRFTGGSCATPCLESSSAAGTPRAWRPHLKPTRQHRDHQLLCNREPEPLGEHEIAAFMQMPNER